MVTQLGPVQPEPVQDNASTREMTFGEKLVGLTFNPSNDDAVGNVKQLFAQITDILYNVNKQNERSELSNILYNHTIGEILNAQMNVVKVLTLKY